MSSFPFQNRILAAHNPEFYWYGYSSGVVADIVNPSDLFRMMEYNPSINSEFFASQSWQEGGRTMTSTGYIRPQFDAAAPIFDGTKSMIVKLVLHAATSYSGGFAKRDLLSLQPDSMSGVDDQAFVATAVEDESTGEVSLLGQVYEGGGWYTYDQINMGPFGQETRKEIYFTVTRDGADLVVEAYSPGLKSMELAYFEIVGAELKLAQINSADQLAGNRPDIGLPPETGTSQNVSFIMASVMPRLPSYEEMMLLIKVDQRGYTNTFNSMMWPADNSRGLTTGVLSAGSPEQVVVEISAEQAASFRAPGPMEIAPVTLVSAEDPTVFERCRLKQLDVLAGQLTILRGPSFSGDPALDWPSGTLVRGMLISRHGDPLIGDGAVAASPQGTPYENREPVNVYRCDRQLNFAGDTWTLLIPNGRLLMVEEVLVKAGTDVTAASIEVFEEGSPVPILDTVTPNVTGGDVKAIPTTTRRGHNRITVTLSGGTGSGYIYLKGALAIY